MGLFWEHSFSTADREALRNAIAEAENHTSGEIRVYFERSTAGEPVLQRAQEAFGALKMHETRDRNGVLFYVAFDDRVFAVIGDSGIHEKVHQDFWDSTRDILSAHFVREEFVEGLVKGITEVGRKLKDYFPYETSDRNELPDEPHFQNERPR